MRRTLTSEAIKNGLEKTAAAHHLQVVTTPLVDSQGVISALPDSSQIIAKAFQSKQGDPPQSAPTGEGYAIFQVTGIAAAHAPELCRLEEPRSGRLSQRATARPAGPEDHGTGRQGPRAMNDLAKAAKEEGATVKTSDLVGETGQVPDFGQVGQAGSATLRYEGGRHQRTHQRAAHRRGGQTGGQAGAQRGRDRQKLRPDPRPDAGESAATKPSASS